MQISTERLEATLSGILSDRYQRKISVKTQEGTNDNHNSDRNDNYAGGDSQLRSLRHGA